MSFIRLLIHRCDLLFPDEAVDSDDYGRTIYNQVEEKNVICFASPVSKNQANDAYADNYLGEAVLFFLSSQKVSEDMLIRDVRDRTGHVFLKGTYEVEKLELLYNRVGLHHFEVTIRRARNG